MSDMPANGAFCYEDSIIIGRMAKQVDVLRRSRHDIVARYLPCPDHRDKHNTGDECVLCQRDRLRDALEWIGDGNITDLVDVMDYARNAALQKGNTP